jgi:hypothetical protein
MIILIFLVKTAVWRVGKNTTLFAHELAGGLHLHG